MPRHLGDEAFSIILVAGLNRAISDYLAMASRDIVAPQGELLQHGHSYLAFKPEGEQPVKSNHLSAVCSRSQGAGRFISSTISGTDAAGSDKPKQKSENPSGA